MRVLILGGTGFMGPHVARRLLEGGHEVALFHRGQTRHDVPDGVTHLLGDRGELGTWRRRFEALRPSVVIHMIAATAQDSWTFLRVFDGVAERAVVASSIDVYRAFDAVRRRSDTLDPLPIGEHGPLRELLYPMRSPEALGELEGEARRRMEDYDKILVERVAQSSPHLPCAILRLPAVYGPHDPRRRIEPWLARMDAGREAILIGRAHGAWRWTRGYVEDVAAAIALAATDPRAAGRVWNVGEQDPPTEGAWVAQIADAAGWHGRIVEVEDDALPSHLQAPGTDFRQSIVVDTSRIRQELGYREVVSPQEAMARTVAWFRAHPSDGALPSPEALRAEEALSPAE